MTIRWIYNKITSFAHIQLQRLCTTIIKPTVYETNLAFLARSLQNSFLDSPFTYQSVDRDLFGLPQSVGAIHSLLVYGGIPIAIVKYHLQS